MPVTFKVRALESYQGVVGSRFLYESLIPYNDAIVKIPVFLIRWHAARKLCPFDLFIPPV